MRTTIIFWAFLVVPLALAHAEDPPENKGKQLTFADVVARVVKAAAAGDEATLQAIAGQDRMDPWNIVEALLARKAYDAAAALAAASTRPMVAGLADYVTAMRTSPTDPERRARLRAVQTAFAKGDAKGGLEATGPDDPKSLTDMTAVLLLESRARAFCGLRRMDDAHAAYDDAGRVAERLGWLRMAEGAYRMAADVATGMGRYTEAEGSLERQLGIAKRRGSRGSVAAILGNLANMKTSQGELQEGLALQKKALAEKEAIGDVTGAAATRCNMSGIYRQMGEFAKALEGYKVAIPALGHAPTQWVTRAQVGHVYMELGDAHRALAIYKEVIVELRKLGDTRAADGMLNNLGNAQASLGDIAGAMSSYEASLAAQEATANKPATANALTNLGNLHKALGSREKALALYERALGAVQAVGDRRSMAVIVGNMATVHKELGNHAKALEMFQAIHQISTAMGDRLAAARALSNIGGVQSLLRQYEKAEASYKGALITLEKLGAAGSAAIVRGHLGSMYASKGDLPEARELHLEALKAKEALGDTAEIVASLGVLSKLHLQMNDPTAALAFARRAVTELNSLARGLGADSGSRAREPMGYIYEAGLAASLATDDAEATLFFLEQGRASALVEGLQARSTLWAATVSPQLREAEASARAQEVAATRKLRTASRRRNRKKIRAAQADLAEAQEKVAGVLARIQREGKAGASILHAEPATTESLQATLADDEALVYYGLTGAEGLALVITKGSARVIRLGEASVIDAAIEALDLEDPTVDGGGPATRLAALLTRPLALPAGVRRVLLSPTGRIGYVPFALLLPTREVAYVPSGTTRQVLFEEQSLRGQKILALGDPDYGSKASQRDRRHRGASLLNLTPLPATRDEVNAIGTTTLLGKQASEPALQSALATEKRWRAVHFACHGLLDAERPMFSSLALTLDGESDGLLTALEIFRMQFPADLVVLSACETGKGTIYKTEGIVGLTRAFMHAGTSRVICSLWKVDDEATQALMIKFYELWNPKAGKGLSPTAALKAAQEYVKAKPKWAHPHYWAAWVLWGPGS